MIELHERLSEFSYGYGVTREVEHLLLGIGVRTVPFLPSLLDEKKVGFDVGFGDRGLPLLLQFKLGQTLHRFVRSDKHSPAPKLQRPFFRFSIDTAEPDGQFETLLKAETDGAEVYYIAPRFADWPHYVEFFQKQGVLQNSVMVRPNDIRVALDSKGMPDGQHRIVYDNSRTHVCSTPVSIRSFAPGLLAESVSTRVRQDSASLEQNIRKVYGGLEDRSSIRRPQSDSATPEENPDRRDETADRPLDERASRDTMVSGRIRRLAQLRERAASENDAITAALGFELWGLGIQLLLAVEEKSETKPP